MRKILISIDNFGLGGIEKSLINLMKKINSEYNIDIIVQRKNDFFETQNIVKKTYKVSNNNNIFIRKIINFFNLIKYYIFNHNKYDVSVSYTTSNKVSSLIALISSKNSVLWIHSNYYYYFNKDINEFKKFFDRIKVHKFNKIVLVSDDAKKDFDNIYPELSNKTTSINNQVDYENIIELGKEQIDININKGYFLFVGRLEERAKKITRLIEAFKLLKENGFSNQLLILGNGPDKEEYVNLIKKYNLMDTIIMIEGKTNPYPYFVNSSCLLLSSDYEGFPVVYLEAIALGKPIITTIDIKSGSLEMYRHAIICDKNPQDIYKNIVSFIKDKPKFDNFNIEKYNEENINKIRKLFNGEI